MFSTSAAHQTSPLQCKHSNSYSVCSHLQQLVRTPSRHVVPALVLPLNQQIHCHPSLASQAAKDATPQPLSQGSDLQQQRGTKPAPQSSAATNTEESQEEDALLQLQLQEADLTVEELLNMKFDVSEEELEGDFVIEDEEQATQDTASTAPIGKQDSAHQYSTEEIAKMQLQKRKATVVMELLKAGPNLEAKIVHYDSEIDEALLRMLASRIIFGHEAGQGADDLAPYEELYKILKYVYDRKTSSPAMRLLDEVLDLLGDDQQATDYEDKKAQAAARLYSSFMGGTVQVDIFAAAAALADKQALAVPELTTEYVGLYDFLAEVTELLSSAKQSQLQLQSSIETAVAEIEHIKQVDPDKYNTEPVNKQLQQVQLARQAFNERASGLLALEDVIFITRTLEMQMKQQGGLTITR